ncbi:hypothetical protein DOY81_010009 [Sarcophaga bullata]|nr:hypothetical protein DOY81_010009 [Sarcophaga bullata]
MMDTTAAKSTEELDAQLINTLREIDPHNYAYLFERCKSCNVNARHLRFFKKDHIRELIPKNELGILAEFEHLLNLWQISKGYASFDTKMQLNRVNESKNLIITKEKPQSLSNLNISTNKPQVQGNLIIAKEKPYILRNNQPVVVAKQPIQVEPVIKNVQASPDENKLSKAKRMRFNEDDDEEFTLEKIIPELLMDLKFSYELNNCLSGQERRLLCRTIVDYFVSRNIKLSLDTLDDLTEQIAEHFPKEDKKSWFNRYDYDKRGRLLVRIQNARRIMARQTASKLATNSVKRGG